MKRTLVSAGIAVLLTGCFSLQRPYPPEWPSLTSAGCYSIVGTYKAMSQPVSGREEERLGLWNFYTDKKIEDNYSAFVDISAGGDKDGAFLKFVIRDAQAVIDETVLRENRKEYECINGEVRPGRGEAEPDFNGVGMRRGYQLVGIAAGPVFEKKFYTFRKAADGSLIIRTESKGRALFFFIVPTAATHVYWARWMPPDSSEDDDYQARQFIVKPDKANIYLYRSSLTGEDEPWTVELDGKVEYKTPGSTCLIWAVEPGLHKITSTSDKTDSVLLSAEAGKNYFIHQEDKFGFFRMRTRLQQVDDQGGKKAVIKCRGKIEDVRHQDASQ